MVKKENNFIPHEMKGDKIGVLLVNLGTPDGYDYWSVRKYLKEFLSDNKVIEVNPILWKIILNLFILPFRPFKTGKSYEEIWLKDINKSPLLFFTEKQVDKLKEKITINYKNIIIDYAMRYGSSSIRNKIQELSVNNCSKIIILPLYPQYSSTTTGTVYDEVYRSIKNLRWQPNIRIALPYHDNVNFINAIANSIIRHIEELDYTPEVVLFTFHGIPQEYFAKGDPYPCFCRKTFRLISEKLQELDFFIPTEISFQSRFGPKEWIKPYTEVVLKDLLQKNIKNICVISPGFSVDCLETLEEINIGYRKLFLQNGGKNFSYIPCLNASDEAIDFIYSIFKENLWEISNF